MGQDNVISQEEREQIIKALRKGYLEDCELHCILFDEKGCGGFSCHDCGEIIKNKLIALIESAPAKKNMQSDGIPYPLDADGVPIKLGDTVYYDGDAYTIDSITVKKSFISDDLRYEIIGIVENRLFYFAPDMITHTESRTLEDIIGDIMYSLEDGACDDPEEDVNKLVHEAYEMGKAAKNE